MDTAIVELTKVWLEAKRDMLFAYHLFRLSPSPDSKSQNEQACTRFKAIDVALQELTNQDGLDRANAEIAKLRSKNC